MEGTNFKIGLAGYVPTVDTRPGRAPDHDKISVFDCLAVRD